MGINRLCGTSWHIETLHSNDERRHLAKCVYYDKKSKTCEARSSPYYSHHCGGSSWCQCYMPRLDIENNKQVTHNPSENINPSNSEEVINMDISEIFDIIKKEFPTEARQLEESLVNTQRAYKSIIEAFSDKARDQIADNKIDETTEYLQSHKGFSNHLSAIVNSLQNSINSLKLDNRN